MAGIKHLLECHCYLSIFKGKNKILNHRFPVYSKIDEFGNIVPKLVKCNNCETLFYVKDINDYELKAGKEDTKIILSKEEIMMSLPVNLREILIKFNCDISDFEHALDVVEEKRWGEELILKREIINEVTHVKVLEINSIKDFKIKNEVINDLIVSFK
tara:strand:- start:11 stop:484 length:474 start_codon:yes stop_codon:yes gene_type:complete